MNKKICLICQPCGLGDILFIQKICHHYASLGYEVVLPVVHEFAWLSNHIENITFVSWEDESRHLKGPPLPAHVTFPYINKYDYYEPSEFTEDFVYLNFFHPSMAEGGRIMENKYSLVNLDYTDWADYIKFTRNTEKENELYYNVLGLKDCEDYVFVNRRFMQRPTVFNYNRIILPSDKKIVEMEIKPGYSLFDWCKVIENASEISMIETSLNYLMESPQLRNNITRNLTLYSRINNFLEVDYLFSLPWRYVT